MFRMIMLICMTLASSLSADIRAAIDFGSGAVKIQAAEVDADGLVHPPLLAKFIVLNLTEDAARNNGSISLEMEQKAMKILRELKREAIEAASNRPVEFSGIATAVFRKAQNGSAILKRFETELGIPFRILDQEEEGKLGFYAAKVLFPAVPEENLLSWDSGNGSFQLTAQNEERFLVYLGPLGHGTLRVILAKDIRGGAVLQPHESGNPVSKEEATALKERLGELLPKVPDWLSLKLASNETFIATFGDGESIFSIIAEAAGKNVLQLSDARKVIEAYIEKNDEAFDAAGLHRKTLTSAILLEAMMEYFGIKTIHFKKSIGVTAGMLVDPVLWQNTKEAVACVQ
jgi:exopolyphosphatase/pppGpp-phosphohydrolase